MRKKYDANFKAKVALEAIREHSSVSELVSKFQLNRVQILNWKKLAISGLPSIFGSGIKSGAKGNEGLIDDLYREIGKLKVENEYLKKKSDTFT